MNGTNRGSSPSRSVGIDVLRCRFQLVDSCLRPLQSTAYRANHIHIATVAMSRLKMASVATRKQHEKSCVAYSESSRAHTHTCNHVCAVHVLDLGVLEQLLGKEQLLVYNIHRHQLINSTALQVLCSQFAKQPC